MAGSGAPAVTPAEFFPSIALVRAAAALLVIYDHFLGVWPEHNNIQWVPAMIVDRWFFTPLQLMQHGGALAVAMFFMVSGFIIVHVGMRESPRAFAIRRALRIYPPLWVSMVALLVAYGIALHVSDADLGGYSVSIALRESNPLPHILAAATLGNYLIGTTPINGVAWTLIIEVLFYVSVFLLLPLLKKRPRVGILVAFAVLGLSQIVAKAGVVIFLTAVNLVFVTYLFLGTLVYLRWAKRIGSGFFVVATAAFWGLFLWGLAKLVIQPPWTLAGYGVSYAFAWFVFVTLLLVDRHIRLDPITAFFSRISYSLYLNHGGLGILALTLLYPRIGYPASLAFAFAAVVAISAASYQWVELPSQRLARRLTARVVTQPQPSREA